MMKCFSCGCIGTMVNFTTIHRHPVYRCSICRFIFWEWPRRGG